MLGAVEREVKVLALRVPNTDGVTLLRHVTQHVIPAAKVYTDEMEAFKHLSEYGFKHEKISQMEEVYRAGMSTRTQQRACGRS